MKVYIKSSLSGIDRMFEKAYLDGKYTRDTAKEYATQQNGGFFDSKLYDSALKVINYVDSNNIKYPELYYKKELYRVDSDYAYEQYYNSGREARNIFVKTYKQFVKTINKKFISELIRSGVEGISQDTYLLEFSSPDTTGSYVYAFICTENVAPLTDKQTASIDSLIESMIPVVNSEYSSLFQGQGDYLENMGDLYSVEYRR